MDVYVHLDKYLIVAVRSTTTPAYVGAYVEPYVASSIRTSQKEEQLRPYLNDDRTNIIVISNLLAL